MNRTAAGTCLNNSTRSTNLRFSTLTPIQTFRGQGRSEESSKSLAGRLVKTWKMCWSALTMTSKTSAMKVAGTRSWNRSLIELTKIVLGRFHFNG